MRAGAIPFRRLMAVLRLATPPWQRGASCSAGFGPDPEIGQGQTGGDTDAGRFGLQCCGRSGLRPTTRSG